MSAPAGLWDGAGLRGWSRAQNPARYITLRCADRGLASMPWSSWIVECSCNDRPLLGCRALKITLLPKENWVAAD